MKTIEEIKEIIKPILDSKNLFLVDLSVSQDNAIEIYIDAMEGANVSSCIKVSKELEEHLNRDEEDFELMVSSAGIGYPFKVIEQYQKNIGKLVEIKGADNSLLQGILKSFNEKEVVVECDEKIAVEGKKKKEIVKTTKTILLEQIKQIKDVIIF